MDWTGQSELLYVYNGYQLVDLLFATQFFKLLSYLEKQVLEFEFRKNVVELKDRTFFNSTFRDNRGLLGLKLSATVHHFEVTLTNVSGMFNVY